MTLETSSDDPPPLETNFDELLEFSETPLPQYEDSALATIENMHHSIIIRIPDPQDNNSKKCEDEEPKYAKVQAKRQSSRSKCSHGSSNNDRPHDTIDEEQQNNIEEEDDIIDEEPLLTPSSNDSAIACTESNGTTEIMRTLPTSGGGSEFANLDNAIETSFHPGKSQMRNEFVRNRSTSGGDALQSIVTALYCKILVILGLAFPMAEVISEKVPRGYYQIFYVYLFLGSLVYLLVIYIDLIKVKSSCGLFRKKPKKNIQQHQNLSRNTSVVGNNSSHSSDYVDGISKLPRPRVHYGSFYLRLGAVLFGIGSMIYSGIEIGMFFELNMDETANCKNLFSVIRPLLQMVFVFVQMYFVFLNHKMNIYKNKFMSRIGLMHMIATNICVWLNILIFETTHEIMDNHKELENKEIALHETSEHHHMVENSNFTRLWDPNSFDLSHIISVCQRKDNIMSKLLKDSGPFLFPCTIEYSLICAAVLFVMWKNIADEHEHYKNQKKRRKISRSLHMNNSSSNQSNRQQTTLAGSTDPEMIPENEPHSKSAHHYSVDCTHANTGLFTGIFVMVLVIISLIVFFVLINQEKYRESAIAVASWTELILYGITSLAVLVGMCQVRRLWYDNSRKLELDNLLLVVAQTGVFIYSAFCIIGSFFEMQDHLMSFLASLATLVQTTLQTVFILDASSRFAYTNEQVKRKPGREVVTFLLVCNLAMWAINTLETNRADSHPIQVDFYGGEWAWPIITHVSMPLAIFYRFHSTVCLCEIWKKSFKFKSPL